MHSLVNNYNEGCRHTEITAFEIVPARPYNPSADVCYHVGSVLSDLQAKAGLQFSVRNDFIPDCCVTNDHTDPAATDKHEQKPRTRRQSR